MRTFSSLEPLSPFLRGFQNQHDMLVDYFRRFRKIAKKDETLKIIPLKTKYNRGECIAVDAEDYERVMRLRPCGYMLGTRFQVSFRKEGKTVTLHRYLLGAKQKGEIVDHIDSHTANLSKRNLRLVTAAQNSQNLSKQKGRFSSDYMGVTWNTKGQHWVVTVRVDNKTLCQHGFDDERIAAETRDLVLAHTDRNVKLNFEEKREEYLSMTPPDFSKPQRKITGVRSSKNGRYAAVVCHHDKEIYAGYGSFQEMVKLYDKYIVENNIYGKKLNEPEKYPDYDPEFKGIFYDYETQGETTIINHPAVKIILDTESFKKINGYPIHLTWSGYPKLTFKTRPILLHRFLMGEPEGLVDHINNDKLDARLKNLRVVSAAQNAANRSKSLFKETHSIYVGVSKTSDGKWSSSIGEKGRRVFTFTSSDEETAARFRDLFLLSNPRYFHKKNFDDWDETTIKKWTIITERKNRKVRNNDKTFLEEDSFHVFQSVPGNRKNTLTFA